MRGDFYKIKKGWWRGFEDAAGVERKGTSGESRATGFLQMGQGRGLVMVVTRVDLRIA
jgi:hypothetical protein